MGWRPDNKLNWWARLNHHQLSKKIASPRFFVGICWSFHGFVNHCLLYTNKESDHTHQIGDWFFSPRDVIKEVLGCNDFATLLGFSSVFESQTSFFHGNLKDAPPKAKGNHWVHSPLIRPYFFWGGNLDSHVFRNSISLPRPIQGDHRVFPAGREACSRSCQQRESTKDHTCVATWLHLIFSWCFIKP